MMENKESLAVFEQLEKVMERMDRLWPEKMETMPDAKMKKIDTKHCPLKAGLKCSILSAKRVDNGIVNVIRDGRCYVEMCPGVKKLIYNNPWDGFGSKAEYDPEKFSLMKIKKRIGSVGMMA